MNEPIWRSRARAGNNGDFISIETYSGYRLPMADPEAPEHILESDVSDEVLGNALLAALTQSRFLSTEEARVLRLTISEYNILWIQKLMTRFGYKNKNDLFRKLKNCGIEREGGMITIRPSHHEKLEAWSGDFISKEDYVKIPADSPSAEIGAALRLAFSRCTGMGA